MKLTEENCSAAKAIVKILAEEGVKDIFGLPGSQVLDLLDEIGADPSMRFILVRDEHGGGFMADAYAQASGKPAVILTTLGPGATNMITGIAAAYKAGSPIIAISGKGDRRYHQRDYFQEIDEVSVFRPITKWSYMISDPCQVQTVFRKAFRIAMSGRPGPVHISIPSDIFRETVTYESLGPQNYRQDTQEVTGVSDHQLDKFFDRVQNAEYPMIVAGQELLWNNAVNDLIALAESMDIPVASSLYYLDAFPSAHRLGLGPLGKGGWGSAMEYLAKADAVVFLGSGLDYMTTNFNRKPFENVASLGQITAYPERVATSMPVDWSVVCNAAAFVRGALKRAQGLPQKGTGRSELVGALKKKWFEQMDEEAAIAGNPMKPQYAAACVQKAMRNDAIIVIDGGNYAKYVRKRFMTYEPNTFFNAADFGTVGSGFTLALGAQAAKPGRQVVSVLGDGAFMMKLSEIETAVRENLPVKVVVFNDNGFGNIRAYQKHRYDERYVGCDYGNPDFGEIAKLFGAYGRKVSDPAELPAALEEAFSYPGLAVLDVMIDPYELGTPLHSTRG